MYTAGRPTTAPRAVPRCFITDSLSVSRTATRSRIIDHGSHMKRNDVSRASAMLLAEQFPTCSWNQRLSAVVTQLCSSSCSAVDSSTRARYIASNEDEHRANPEGLSDLPSRRVADYSGGYERRFPHRIIRAAAVSGDSMWEPRTPSPAVAAACANYIATHSNITGLLLAQPGGLLVEEYALERTRHHRLQSWSMAKSVTSLLLGICLDRKLIRSLDDRADVYCANLVGTLHGGISLRHLANMCSGAAVDHIPSNVQIYTEGFTNPNSSVRRTVAGWNCKDSDFGRNARFNYNELCPLAIGMVIRAVTNQSLSEFCESALWQPLGAEADASWQTDSEGNEFNCIGFGCCLRDWGKLGLLIAQRGISNTTRTRVISDAYFTEIFNWRIDEQQTIFVPIAISLRDVLSTGHKADSALVNGIRYKAFLWHCKADGTQPRLVGHGGQTIVCDIPSQTVLVQTAVEDFDAGGQQLTELLTLFDISLNAS
eukprot:SAG31_NODE_1542_length_7951_cov_4.038844_8_plen_484_part_00